MDNNPRRGGAPKQLYCKRGHTLRGKNVMLIRGGRRCRACYRAAQRVIMQKRRAKGAA